MDPRSCWDRCSPVHPPGCLFKGSAPHWPLFHSSLNPSGLILFFFCLFRSSHPVISAIESDVLGSLLTAGSENRQRPPDVSEHNFVFGVVFAEPRIFHPRGCTYPQPRAGREPCVLEGELSAIYTKAPFSPAEGPPCPLTSCENEQSLKLRNSSKKLSSYQISEFRLKVISSISILSAPSNKPDLTGA